MTPELKTELLAALRSGKYEQNRIDLDMRTPDGRLFSTLGVLADIADPRGWIYFGKPKLIDGHRLCGFDPEEGIWLGCTFCDETLQKLGLTDDAHAALIEMDSFDRKGQPQATFAEIADWVEANV